MAGYILRPPRLRTTESEAETHKVTWLELFYDLVFVVVVANLGGRLLTDDLGWKQVAGFVGLFIPVWWAWAGFTFYADRYDTDDLGQRLLAVAQMVTIAIMAASISGEAADSSVAFALSYVGARAILIAMYVRARKHVPGTRDLVTGYIKGFSLGAAVWLASVFVPRPYRFWMWAIGLAISFATPYYYRKIQAKVPLDVSHLPERMGLFTILVLGESIAAVVVGLSHREWELEATIVAVIGVLIATSLWWLYFDDLDGTVVRRKPEQTKAWKPTAWIYSHLPLAIALVATGIGLEFIVAEVDHDLATAERWLVVGGVAFVLLSLAMIHVATESPADYRRDARKAQTLTIGAAAVLLIGVLSRGSSSLVLAILLIAVTASLIGADVMINLKARALASD